MPTLVRWYERHAKDCVQAARPTDNLARGCLCSRAQAGACAGSVQSSQLCSMTRARLRSVILSFGQRLTAAR